MIVKLNVMERKYNFIKSTFIFYYIIPYNKNKGIMPEI